MALLKVDGIQFRLLDPSWHIVNHRRNWHLWRKWASSCVLFATCDTIWHHWLFWI